MPAGLARAWRSTRAACAWQATARWWKPGWRRGGTARSASWTPGCEPLGCARYATAGWTSHRGTARGRARQATSPQMVGAGLGGAGMAEAGGAGADWETAFRAGEWRRGGPGPPLHTPPPLPGLPSLGPSSGPSQLSLSLSPSLSLSGFNRCLPLSLLFLLNCCMRLYLLLGSARGCPGSTCICTVWLARCGTLSPSLGSRAWSEPGSTFLLAWSMDSANKRPTSCNHPGWLERM